MDTRAHRIAFLTEQLTEAAPFLAYADQPSTQGTASGQVMRFALELDELGVESETVRGIVAAARA